MSTKKKDQFKIVWQKNENLFEKIEEKLHQQKNLDENFDEDFEDDEEEIPYGDQEEGNSKGRQPFLFTNDNAAIPVHEYFPSSKIYNFWIGYTNFPITDDVIDVIDNTNGVETLERFTRYRMRVSVAKLFKSSDVLSSIGKNVKQFLDRIEKGK